MRTIGRCGWHDSGIAARGSHAVAAGRPSTPEETLERLADGTLRQPLFQPPGIGDVIGYPGQEVRLHTYPQGSVRQFYQPDPADPAAVFGFLRRSKDQFR